jgi:hypothetical protein
MQPFQTAMHALMQLPASQDIPVGKQLMGHRLGGVVASHEPQLLEKDSQVLFCLLDNKTAVVQVRLDSRLCMTCLQAAEQ